MSPARLNSAAPRHLPAEAAVQAQAGTLGLLAERRSLPDGSTCAAACVVPIVAWEFAHVGDPEMALQAWPPRPMTARDSGEDIALLVGDDVVMDQRGDFVTREQFIAECARRWRWRAESMGGTEARSPPSSPPPRAASGPSLSVPPAWPA